MSDTTGLDVGALRAVAEAALRPVTCGGHLTIAAFFRCEQCRSASNAADDLTATFDPPTVLALLDRLQAAEAAVERVRDLAVEWDHLTAFICGVGARPDDEVRQREYAGRADDLWAAVGGAERTTRARFIAETVANQLQPPSDASGGDLGRLQGAGGSQGRSDGDGPQMDKAATTTGASRRMLDEEN